MNRQQVYLEYVAFVGQGDCTRKEAAEHFKVHKSTAQYHLEAACLAGELERFQSWTTGTQQGWVYRKAGTKLELPSTDEYGRDAEEWYDEVLSVADATNNSETPRF